MNVVGGEASGKYGFDRGHLFVPRVFQHALARDNVPHFGVVVGLGRTIVGNEAVGLPLFYCAVGPD